MLAVGCARRLGGQRRGHSAAVAVECGNWRSCRSGRCCISAGCAVALGRETAEGLVLARSGGTVVSSASWSPWLDAAPRKVQDGLKEGATHGFRRGSARGQCWRIRRTSSLGSFPVYVCVRATTSYPTTQVSHTFICTLECRVCVHSSRKATVRCIWLTASAPAPGHGTFRSWNIVAMDDIAPADMQRKSGE
jgi:hypothetical protein